MGAIKGQKEYLKFKNGEKLTRKQAIIANCYSCNGLEDSATECFGKSCPLYQYRPYKKIKKLNLRAESGSFMTPQTNQTAGVK
jgi:hypothetical protein